MTFVDTNCSTAFSICPCGHSAILAIPAAPTLLENGTICKPATTPPTIIPAVLAAFLDINFLY